MSAKARASGKGTTKDAAKKEGPGAGENNGARDTIGLTVRKSEDFSEWYNQVVQKSGLADYAPIAGCMVIKPLGFAVWESIQSWFDRRIKESGHANAYFPLFIPERLLKKEAEHFEGFTPEVAWVVEEGEQGAERFALRPTSETVIYDSYAKWIRSWRDLPLLLNQWCNIVRWETRATRLFLRTREFLWQEGHTAHATHDEAEAEARMILGFYRELMETQLAIPVLTGEKTARERFAGALRTYTLESLMQDGRALQMGTSHNLGQNFSKPFGIRFRDRDEKEKHVWQTSWGISTRLIGAAAMVHGDDRGLILPPNIAPVQVVVIPIIFEESRKAVMKEAEALAKKLGQRFKTKLDAREDCSAGWKFNEWEMKGVPLRIELGPIDLKKKQAVLVRRDSGAKKPVRLEGIEGEVRAELNDVQKSLFEKARKSMESRIDETKTFAELEKAVAGKRMAKACLCGAQACEDAIQEKTTATVRLIAEGESPSGSCAVCGKKAVHVVYVARQY